MKQFNLIIFLCKIVYENMNEIIPFKDNQTGPNKIEQINLHVPFVYTVVVQKLKIKEGNWGKSHNGQR